MANGMDLLKDELIKVGYTSSKISANSDFIKDIVKILSNADTLHKTLEEVIDYNKKASEDYKRAELRCREAENMYRLRNGEALESKCEYINLCQEYQQKIVCAMTPETPEARDAMRRFIIFKSVCHINTVYDNTAFIKGCAAILANLTPDEKAEYEIDMDALLDAAEIKGNKARKAV